MPIQKTQQFESSRKEASLAVVGSNLVQQPLEQIYTHNDAEYHRYSQLLKGFFEKFTRWQDILAADGYEDKERYMGFLIHEESWSGSVFRLDTVLSMTPTSSLEEAEPGNKIIQIRYEYRESEPEVFFTHFCIRPAPAGKHLFIDPDGTALDEINITIGDNTNLVSCFVPRGRKSLDIRTSRQSDKPQVRSYMNKHHRRLVYSFRENTLKVDHKYNVGYDVMTDEMATNLINTIDALIPGSTSPTQQPESRAMQKTPTPKSLPPARRTRPPGR